MDAVRAADNVAVLPGEAEKPAAAPVAATESLELPQMSCFTCKFIMGEGKRILEEDSTVDQLTTLVETVCNDLNGDLKVDWTTSGISWRRHIQRHTTHLALSLSLSRSRSLSRSLSLPGSVRRFSLALREDLR